MQHDYLVYIGRFQPIHCGHVHVIRKALEICETLIMVIGSDQKAADIRDPFSTKERIKLITLSLKPEERQRIRFVPQVDYMYNDDRWIASIQASVNTLILNEPWSADGKTVGIIGYDKDHTTYYLKKFPQYEFVSITPINGQNATDFRKALFEDNLKVWKSYCATDAVYEWLLAWDETDEYKRLVREYEHIRDYKKGWEKAPYPPTFVTVDAVVRQSGHLLLVTRRDQPGEGLWALPGGFVNQTESLEEAVIRELYEETRIDVPKPVIKGSITGRRVFDNPNRSTRGRTITECFDIKLNDGFDLPRVKGSDDADKAFWVPYAEVVLNRDKFFEDHFSMIQAMVGL
jgi:bifunctional NMN adenylyltransferase/nudix hydrolase